ncbi:MAG: hypothetical protein EBU88_07480 [Acidobacteria bacterium]|nr:hypothetical protein [Acidobacteriota bacterium]
MFFLECLNASREKKFRHFWESRNIFTLAPPQSKSTSRSSFEGRMEAGDWRLEINVDRVKPDTDTHQWCEGKMAIWRSRK